MRNKPIQPIIILGAGRSGTKFLRDSLLASHETCAIPYDVNYIWRTGNENYPDDELPPSCLSPQKTSIIRNTLFRMSGADSGSSKFMLEKTVGNTLRVPFIHNVFPEAKFINLVRDGRAVTESAMRLWTTPPESRYLLKKIRYFPARNYRYAIAYAFNMAAGLFSGRGQKTWGPMYKGIHDDIQHKSLLEICAKQWDRCVSKATHDLQAINPSMVHTIRYEDMMSSEKSFQELCYFIGISDTEHVTSKFMQNSQSENLDKWRTQLSKEQIHFLNESLHEMLSTYDYQ